MELKSLYCPNFCGGAAVKPVDGFNTFCVSIADAESIGRHERQGLQNPYE